MTDDLDRKIREALTVIVDAGDVNMECPQCFECGHEPVVHARVRALIEERELKAWEEGRDIGYYEGTETAMRGERW
jgi:hypothetical protein